MPAWFSMIRFGLQKQCEHNRTVPNRSELNGAGATPPTVPARFGSTWFGYDVIITFALIAWSASEQQRGLVKCPHTMS